MGRELTQTEISRICSEYRDRRPSTRIARELGVSTHVVLRTLRQNGVSIRSKGGRERVYGAGWTAEFVRAYTAGEPIRAIAERMGVGQGTVWRALTRTGAGRRPQGLRAATVARPTDPAELGYLAGLIDGEGNLQFKTKHGERSIGCKLAVYNTHAGVMDWLAARVGGAVRWDTKRTARDGSLPCGIWELCRARDVATVLSAVLPYLIVKRDAARAALALFAERFALTGDGSEKTDPPAG